MPRQALNFGRGKRTYQCRSEYDDVLLKMLLGKAAQTSRATKISLLH